jgi:colanic acid biosynthesis glycosyl transferase WcaI
MKILIYGLNFYPELTGTGKYTGEMAAWLADQNNEVKIITAPPYYPEWKIAKGYKKFEYKTEHNKNITIQRCPLYVPKNQTTIKRLIHLISFSISSFFPLVSKFIWRPDLVIVVAPTLLCAPGGILLAKLTGAKSILHIQDFEIDAMFGLGMMKRGLVYKTVINIEKRIFRGFDMVSTISRKMMLILLNKGVLKEKIYFFPNWVDIDFINPSIDTTEYKINITCNENSKIVLYSGNIGNKQGLDIILDVAEAFKDNKDLKFVISGSGAYKKELKELTLKRNIDNIIFRNLVPYSELPLLINSANIHLVIQKKGTADAFLPSKITTILSAGGHAIVSAETDTELGILNEKFPGIMERVEPEDPELIILSIKKILSYNSESFNPVARDYAVKYLKKDNVIMDFYKKLQTLVN